MSNVVEAVFETVPMAKLATTTVAVFSDLNNATSALPELVNTGAATLELMDAASIKVGQGFRSEERRVGKERRSRRAPERHDKKTGGRKTRTRASARKEQRWQD